MTDLTFTIKLTGADAGGSAAVQKVVDLVKQLGLEENRATAGAQRLNQNLRATGSAAGAMEKAVGTLKRLVGGLSIALLARQFGHLALGELEAANAIGKLSQALGVGTEALSVFKFAAKGVNVDTDQLAIAFRNLAKAQQEAKNPNSQAAAALKALGISAEEIADLPLDKFLLRVANAAERFGASGAKLEALGTILGPRVVTPLIPLLQKLAGDGFAKARAEAEKFGLVVSEASAAKAAAFGDALARLKGAVHGIAGEFSTGFAPAVAQAFEAMSVGAGEAGGSLRDFGSVAGTVFKSIVFLTGQAARNIGFVWASIKSRNGPEIRKLFDELTTASTEAFTTLFPPKAVLAARRAEAEGEVLKLQVQLREAAKKTGATPEPFERLSGLTDEGLQIFRRKLEGRVLSLRGAVDLTDPASAKTAREAANARIDAALEGIRGALAVEKVGFETQQQQADESYRRGLVATQEFFEDRARILREGVAAELAALDRQRVAVAKRPTSDKAEDAKKAQELTKLDEARGLLLAKQDKDLLDNTNKRRAAEEELGRVRLEFERAVLTAQGRTTDAQLSALRQELDEQRKKLGKNITPAETAGLETLRTLGEAQIQVDRLQGQAALVFGGLQLEVDRINDAVARGVISASDGEREILALQKDRLPVLAAMRASLVLLQGVLEDPVSLLAVQQLIDKIDAFGRSTAVAIGLTVEFKKGLVDATSSVVTDQLNLLGDIIRGTNEDIHSVGDAFKALALIAVNAIQQIIVRLIALQAQKAIAGLLGLPVAEQGGLVQVFAAGGPVYGPSHRAGGKRIEVEGGEYVIRRAAVRRIGVDFLDLLNAAGPLPRLRSYPRYRYGSGGEVLPPAGDAADRGGHVGIRVGLDPGLIAEQVETGPVERAVIRVIQKNRRALGI